MRHLLVCLGLLFFFGCSREESPSVVTEGPSVPSPSPTPFPGPDPSELFDEVNLARRVRGLPELTMNEALTCAALRHAWDIGPKNMCSNRGSDGSDLTQRVRGCRGAATAEIIGCNYLTARQAVDAWTKRLDSARLLYNYNMMQMGVAEVNHHYVVVFLGML